MNEINQGFENDIPFSLAERAHAGTSHDPRRRAEQEIASYAEQLRTDSAIYSGEVEKARDAGNTELVAAYSALWEEYRAGYAKRTRDVLEAKSRCVSTLIVGPANFNTSRARMASYSADRYLQAAEGFRVSQLRALRRIVFPNEAPVACGDEDAVERLRAKLDEAEKFQKFGKKVNEIIRKNRDDRTPGRAWTLSNLQAAIVEFGQYQDRIDIAPTAAALLVPDALGRIGVPDYRIKNNGAEIRRLKARIESVSSAKSAEVQTDYHAATMITMSIDRAANRVRLRFPCKPDRETRSDLKANGFLWAPTVEGGVWQAYHNASSQAFAAGVASRGARGYDGPIVDTGSRP